MEKIDSKSFWSICGFFSSNRVTHLHHSCVWELMLGSTPRPGEEVRLLGHSSRPPRFVLDIHRHLTESLLLQSQMKLKCSFSVHTSAKWAIGLKASKTHQQRQPWNVVKMPCQETESLIRCRFLCYFLDAAD